MNLMLIIAAVAVILAACWAARRLFSRPKFDPESCAANTWASATVGTHTNSVAKVADAALAAALLVTRGTDDDHINLAGASDVPLGVIEQNNSAATGERITVLLLGVNETRVLTANGAITANSLVYGAASGKCASSGTQCIGVAITTTTTDGDFIEVKTCIPQPSPGISASTFDANSTLIATADNTPVVQTFAANQTLARGSSGNLTVVSLLSGGNNTAVAAAGSTTTDAAALTARSVNVVSSDSAAKGVKLWTGVAGMTGLIFNNTATACKIYPATGGTINGGSVDASKTLAASKGVIIGCTAADTWWSADMAAQSS